MNLYVVTGQTATGKTQYALDLAKQHNGELINADSRQIYQKLDIVTGKEYAPDVRIWLYDIVDPKQLFSSHDFNRYATQAITDIASRGKTPIIVGGSWFYIQNLLYGTIKNNIPPNQKLRTKLAEKSVVELQELLRRENTELFESLNTSEQHNPQRLIRRIEKEQYIRTHLNDHSSKKGGTRKMGDVTKHIIGLQFASPELLSQAITARVEKRLHIGAIDEVKALLDAGYTADDPGLNTIGYQQIITYLKGDYTFAYMKAEWITREIQYAKRQLTFMKQDSHIKWQKIG